METKNKLTFNDLIQLLMTDPRDFNRKRYIRERILFESRCEFIGNLGYEKIFYIRTDDRYLAFIRVMKVKDHKRYYIFLAYDIVDDTTLATKFYELIKEEKSDRDIAKIMYRLPHYLGNWKVIEVTL